jgi:hypothetical protein
LPPLTVIIRYAYADVLDDMHAMVTRHGLSRRFLFVALDKRAAAMACRLPHSEWVVGVIVGVLVVVVVVVVFVVVAIVVVVVVVVAFHFYFNLAKKRVVLSGSLDFFGVQNLWPCRCFYFFVFPPFFFMYICDVCLASMIATGPAVVLLDEATYPPLTKHASTRADEVKAQVVVVVVLVVVVVVLVASMSL